MRLADPRPARVFASIGFTPAALTLTTASPIAWVTMGTFAGLRTSGPPTSDMTTACISLIPPR